MQEMWDNYKMCYICTIVTYQREKNERKKQEVSELIMGENFPELMADTKQQIHKFR